MLYLHCCMKKNSLFLGQIDKNFCCADCFSRFFGVQNLDIFVAPISIVFGFELILRLYCPLLMDFESKNCILRVSKFDPKFGLQSIHEPWRAGSPQKIFENGLRFDRLVPAYLYRHHGHHFLVTCGAFHQTSSLESRALIGPFRTLLFFLFLPQSLRRQKTCFPNKKHTNNKH